MISHRRSKLAGIAMLLPAVVLQATPARAAGLGPDAEAQCRSLASITAAASRIDSATL